MLFMLLIFQKMRLALERKTDALYAGRQQAHEDAELFVNVYQR